jgi:hypothetical protein
MDVKYGMPTCGILTREQLVSQRQIYTPRAVISGNKVGIMKKYAGAYVSDPLPRNLSATDASLQSKKKHTQNRGHAYMQPFTIRVLDGRHTHHTIRIPSRLCKAYSIRVHLSRFHLDTYHSHPNRPRRMVHRHSSFKLYTKDGKSVAHFDRSRFYQTCLHSDFLLVTSRQLLFRTRPPEEKTPVPETALGDKPHEPLATRIRREYQQLTLGELSELRYITADVELHWCRAAEKRANLGRKRVLDYPKCQWRSPLDDRKRRRPHSRRGWTHGSIHMHIIVMVIVTVNYNDVYGGHGRGCLRLRRINHQLYQPRSHAF